MKKIAFVLMLAVLSLEFSSCSKKNDELSDAAQLEKDIAAIDAYLATNLIVAVKDSSGARYVIEHQGTGMKPAGGGKISVRFTGTFLSGQTFTQSDGATLYLTDVIQGWKIILPRIFKGSKLTLYLPSGLAYGHEGAPSVPGNTIVVFEIELLDDDVQLAADVAAIDAYLDTVDNVLTDPRGFRYVFIGDPGTGPIPGTSSNVSITYTGKFLKDNKVFETQDSPIFISMSQVIEGFSMALQLIPSGSTVTLYIPSGLAFGAGGTPDGVIPPNANLIYEVHLVGIIN